MTTHKIAVIAGDGIGKEVVPAAIDCLERIAQLHSLDLEFTYFDWGSEYYAQHGRMMPADGLEQLAQHDAIFLGAVGSPDVPDAESLWGLADPHPPRIPAVHQPSSGQNARRRHVASCGQAPDRSPHRPGKQ